MVKTPNVFLEGTRRSVHNPPQLVSCAALGTVSLGKNCKMLPRSNERENVTYKSEGTEFT